MEHHHGTTFLAIMAIIALATSARAENPALTQRRSVEAAMLKANLYYQNNFTLGTAVWNRAADHVGNLRSWQYLGLQRDLDYALSWSTANNWTVPPPRGTAFADAHCSGQIYIDLYRIDPQPVRIANIKASMDALVGASSATDGSTWEQVITGQSSGTSAILEKP